MNQREKKHYFSLCMLALLLVVLLCSCGSKKSSKANSPKQPKQQMDENEVQEVFFTGVVKNIDEDLKSVTVFDINEKTDYVFQYTGGTDIKDAYNQVIAMSQVTLGEIVTVTFQGASQKLISLIVCKEGWEYRGVGNLLLDKTNYRMKIADRNYWYDEGLMVLSNDKQMDLIDLNPRDILTVKGVGSRICSIIVTTGHGYIRLTNYKDFVGGTIEVGYGIILPIVENMLIVAREGEHRVTLENGELTAQSTIVLERDKEVVLDYSKYRIKPERVGYVRFEIEPFGADLYINGTIVNYSEPIKMNYGKHKIRVTMNGYEDFNGILTIGELIPTININLIEGTYETIPDENEDLAGDDSGNGTYIEPTPEEEKPKDETSNETPDDATPNEDNETEKGGTISIDKEHTITVQEPAGASLYLNGTFKGTIPVTFVKEIGNHIFVLSQTGYATTSYSVEVIDDGENPLFKFAEMLPEE